MAGGDQTVAPRVTAASGRRRVLALALLALLACVGAQRSAASAVDNALMAQTPIPPAFRFLATQRAVQISEPGYRLAVDQSTGIMEIASPGGVLYTSVPLTALVGRSAFPKGTSTQVTRTMTGVRVDTVDRRGRALVSAEVTPSKQSFTVRFTAVVDSAAPAAQFFHNGSRGFDQSTIGAGFTPDANSRWDSRFPTIDTTVRTPLAPAPLDIQLRAAPGWMGVGLVEVPAAGSISFTRSGAVQIDYPLAALAQTTKPFTFPGFVVTFAGTVLDGVRAYHDALVALGAAPASPTKGPAWWHDPVVDTWGEQVATGAARTSRAFTAAWVRNFAQEVRARYGLDHATMVIDSAWQRDIGEAEPDPARFGSWSGMRQLIDTLHAQGFRVLLWWPLWAHDIRSLPARRADFTKGSGRYLDPGVSGFDTTLAATVTKLVGTAPGDLGADGVKLDWAYDIPGGLTDPITMGGALGLYHYLDVIHATVGRVHPGAIVEASAASPQFERVSDSIRLYDAWTQRDWERRAAIVSAANPGQLIDGDGWETTPADAVEHAVTSTVYGVPALYFSSHWATGQPVDPAEAQTIGAVMSLASQKRDGVPTRTAQGWRWQGTDGSSITTYWSNTVVVAWHPGKCGGSGTIVATVPGTYSVPLKLPASASLSLVTRQLGASVSRQGDTAVVSLPAGRAIAIRGSC